MTTLSAWAATMAKRAAKVEPNAKEKLEAVAQVCVGYERRAIQQVHAVDTGSMLNSVRAEKEGEGYLVGPTVSYAQYVALGTSRMAARPFHQMAADQAERDVPKIMKDLINA